MKLVKATSSDNDLLRKFFEETTLPGSVHLGIERPQGFFKPYQLQSDDYATYMLINRNNDVSALASILFREGWVEGEKQVIGYATDLRVSSSRSAVLQWSQHFLPALEQERAAHNCKYVFSVVAQGQRQAYNAFIRPRSPKRQMPRYYSFRSFSVILLHGLYPFAPKPLKTIETRKATNADKEALFKYLLRKKKQQPYYFNDTPEDLEKSLKRWQNLFIEDFWISYDSDDNIVGCVAPWTSRGIQNWIPREFKTKGKSLQESLQLASYIGLAHKFGSLNEPLDFYYLTNLYSENPDIFYSLLWHSFKATNKNQFLAYTHFESDLLASPPNPFIHSSAKANLHCILSPSETPPELLRPKSWEPAPNFELAFL